MTTTKDDLALVDAKLEEIFQRVEEESEKRAADGTKERRRGSVSITRFGQLAEEEGDNSLSAIAAKSSLYHTPIHSRSRSTLGSQLDNDEDGEDQHHITQIHEIAPKASISRAVGNMIARRTGRSRSGSVLSTHETGAVVIGVSVLETTQEHVDLQPSDVTTGDSSESTPVTVTVGTVTTGSIRPRSSRLSLMGGKKGLLARAKSLGHWKKS